MSISTALSNANSGLTAATTRANIVSNNVANALTPGYSRRDVSVSENVVAGQGLGVSVNGITRAADRILTSDRRLAEAASTRDQELAAAYAKFNTALGEPDDPFSLFGQYQGLESSFRSLALTPESVPAQAQVLDAAKALATRFNQLSAQARSSREEADAAIAQTVDRLNTTLKEIEKLNNQISRAGASNRDISGLLDQRKLLIDEVSAQIPVREVVRNNGTVDLMTHEGVFLIAGKARTIEFSRATIITPDASIAGGQLSGLSVEGIDITPGTSASFSLQQGRIAGLFAVRDDAGPDFQAKLDALATDLMQRFEAADPTLAPGAAGLFTDAGAAYDPANQTGLAGRIAINANVDPDQGGALWRLRDGVGAAVEGPAGNANIIFALLDEFAAQRTPPAGAGLTSQTSAMNAIANVTSMIGASRINAESRLAASSANTEALREAETQSTGVDTDFEMQKLLQIEQAYAANARVIQVASEMLDRLMEL
ncbi:MAG: flagellar hook-associated protein FlgK [Hyphococcus sp.]